MGGFDGVGAIMRSTVLQLAVPDEIRGRATAVLQLSNRGGPSLGQVILGALAASITAPSALLVGAAVGVLTLVVVLIFVRGVSCLPGLRERERRAALGRARHDSDAHGPSSGVRQAAYAARKRATPSARAVIPLRATVMTSRPLRVAVHLWPISVEAQMTMTSAHAEWLSASALVGRSFSLMNRELAVRPAEPYQLLPRARRTAGHQQLSPARPPHDIEHSVDRAAVLLAAADIAVLRRYVDRCPVVARGLPAARPAYGKRG